ncbi:MAG TPA: hypothetical protein VH107_20065 [Lacipirellulaceae bacterium]|nr:hypothetical protein [Lacipirellulaceae bacterium]
MRSRPIEDIVADGLWNGAVATAATTAVASLCGEIESQSVAAPLNAVSHIVWGDDAARHSEPSARYTVPGLLLNGAAVTSWAILQEVLFDHRQVKKSLSRSIAEGAMISGLAYVTDYHVVPPRLTPGFEKRLSNKSLATIYAALALSLGVAAWWRKR